VAVSIGTDFTWLSIRTRGGTNGGRVKSIVLEHNDLDSDEEVLPPRIPVSHCIRVVGPDWLTVTGDDDDDATV